jgi:hypothetical protein
MEKSKIDMKEQLNDLIRKAKAFDLASKSSDTNAHIKELEGKYKQFEEKRGIFGQQLERLKSMILGNEEKTARTEPAAPQEEAQPKKMAKSSRKAAKPARKSILRQKKPTKAKKKF